MSSYEYDIFVSYRRMGNIPYWVSTVLVPELEQHLDAYLDQPVRIAVDVDVLDTGDPWPDKLSAAFLNSKIVLPVLSANYFRSGWCASEWQNAIERERLVKVKNSNSSPVVYPIRYNDLKGDDFSSLPDQLKDEINNKMIGDFGDYTTLVNPKSDSERAQFFRDDVLKICERKLRESIQKAPPFDKNWPSLPKVPWMGDDPRWRSVL